MGFTTAFLDCKAAKALLHCIEKSRQAYCEKAFIVDSDEHLATDPWDHQICLPAARFLQLGTETASLEGTQTRFGTLGRG